jgi:serine/threonine protein kinase
MTPIEREKEKEKSLKVIKKPKIIDNEYDTIITEELLEKYKDRTLINLKYIFKQIIGSGGFGIVYSGKNIISGEKVAIKTEEINFRQYLLWESKIMNHLFGINGVPKLRYYGNQFDRNIIVMDLYSHTLSREIENLRNGINVDNHEIIQNTNLIHDEKGESHLENDSRNEHNTPDIYLINDTINDYIVEELMTILNPMYKNILENVNSNDTNDADDTEESLVKYKENMKEYSSKLNSINTNITNIKGKIFDILSDENNARDTIDELNEEIESLNSKKKEMLKDLNNINSKIINHKCNEINKIQHIIFPTNDNLDINNENMNEYESIYSNDEDHDDHNESIFEVVECDTNGDTNVDKSKNYIVKEVTKYCIMILQIIKKIHDKGIIHRDIKPDNIMIGSTKSDNGCTEKKVYLIDFGLSSFYISNDKHIINLKINGKVGTQVFMSKNIYEGNDCSRRDDIISILYTVIYLIKGALPWDGLPTSYDIKLILTTEEICLGIPNVFKKLLDYAYSLKFEDRPDYSYMIRQCKHLLRTL